MRFPALFAVLAATSSACAPGLAQEPVNQAESSTSVDVARTAGLVVAAPLVIDAVVRRARDLKPAEAPGIAPGQVRLYVEADVTALIRGGGGVAPRLTYLVDLPRDSRGRPPRIKRLRVMLFARPVPGRAGEVQLVRPDAQIDWSPALDARVRALAAEAVRPDAPPAIAGVASAIHVPGNLTGEGESQIFLRTSDERPVSLTILRRPGQAPQWSVSLAEVVTDTAGPPRPGTLLWYRLACGLPRELPADSLEALGPADAAIAREDYRFVLNELGPCG